MAQITNKATVRWDGNEFLSDGKGKLKIGGPKREPKVGAGGVQGYTEEEEAPELTIKVRHTKGTSLRAIQNITNATVLIDLDTGRQLIMREAFVTDVIELDFADGYEVKMSGTSCEEV